MKRILIIFAGLFLTVTIAVPLMIYATYQTVWEIPLKVIVGAGRIYADRVNIEIEVNGKRFNEGVAFRRRSDGEETFVIFFETKGLPHEYAIINIFPNRKLVGTSGNTPANGAVLIGGLYLLQSDISFGVIPLDFTIKSGMAEPNFKTPAANTFVFDALPDCSGLPASLTPEKCLKQAELRKSTSWSPLPFGEWRIKYLDG